MRIGVPIAPGDNEFFSAHRGCGVFKDHFKRVRNLAVVIEDIFTAEGTHSLGCVNTHRPMHYVHQVYAPVGQCSSGIVPEGAEAADAAIAVVGVVRSGAKPKVPVQPRRRIGIWRIAHAARRAIAVNPRLGERDLSDFSAVHQLHRFLKVFARALLRADLHHAVVLRRRLDHLAALGQSMRKRFFDVNILAGFASHDHRDGVPMVGGRDDHRLYVLTVEDGAKILEAFCFPVRKLESAVEIGYERIGDSDDIDLVGFLEIAQVELTHSTGADQAHANPVVGPQDALRDWPSGSDHAHGCASQGLVKVPPCNLKVGHFLLYLLIRFASGGSRAFRLRPGTFSRDIRLTEK